MAHDRTDAKSLIFGGYDLSADFAEVIVSRSVLPPAEASAAEHGARPGAILSGVRLSPLQITALCRLASYHAEELADVRRRIAAALWSEEPKPLVFADEPDKYYLAVVQGQTELDRLYVYPQVEITFYCADPIAYGRRKFANVAGGGAFAHSGGTYPTLPSFAGVQDGVGFFEISDGESFVRTLDEVPAGASVAVDMSDERVTVDGKPVAVELGSRYFPILGAAEISCSASGTLEWNERWL